MIVTLLATAVVSSAATCAGIFLWALRLSKKKKADYKVGDDGYVELTKSPEDYRLAGGIELTFQPYSGGDPIVWKNVTRSSDVPQPYLELMRRKFQGQYDMLRIIYTDDPEESEELRSWIQYGGDTRPKSPISEPPPSEGPTRGYQ